MSELQAAKVELAFEQPFFASLLMKRPIKEDRSIPTMGVDRRGQIFYNPEWIAKLSRPHLKFVLCHEVMHVVCMHLTRRGNRDSERWNVAGDYFINSFLSTSGLGTVPEGGLFKEGSETKTTEEIYDGLGQQDDQQSGSGGIGQGDELGGDLLERGEPLTQAEAAEEELRVRLDIADAARNARERGRASGSLLRLIDEVLNTKLRWYEILDRYFSGFTEENQSWKRPNRRFSASDIYLPVNDHEPSMGTVVIGIDTSGSIGDKELSYFGGHLNAILEQCHPEKVYVVYCDDTVSHVDEFTQEAFPVKLEPHGGGGTDMREIVAWIEEQNIEPDVCCILTDGYTPFPESSPCPLVWAITTDEGNPPCGDVVRIDMEA